MTSIASKTPMAAPVDLAAGIAAAVATATAAANHEASLRAVIEGKLGEAARTLGVPWSDHTLDLTLSMANGSKRFVDSVHGAVVTEYEPPRSFRGGSARKVLEHAQAQAEENAGLISLEEGRPVGEYVLLAWDGDHISFGRLDPNLKAVWEPLRAFDAAAAERVLTTIRDNGVSLVYPSLLAELVGPESKNGQSLLPALYNAVRATVASGRTSKTLLLYTEWRRLFGQVVGIADEGLRDLLVRQGEAHGTDYTADPTAYLFALNTHIAIVAKLVAGMALPTAADLADHSVPVDRRIRRLEQGDLFRGAGVLNMLTGQDFFAWYADDPAWPTFEPLLGRMLDQLAGMDFDVRRKTSASLRDLFKGLYMSFAPRELRHALGEFYTPDWLAEHVLDETNWQPENDLLDPTCGSGTFILEALRRRLADPAFASADASELLDGLFGLDLNPLAVLSARASLVVFLSNHLNGDHPVRLPVFLADAVNVSIETAGIFEHRIQTERGEKRFRVPGHMVRGDEFFAAFARLRALVNAGLDVAGVFETLAGEFGLDEWNSDDREALMATVTSLVELHAAGWDGIWASILADRFAAAAIRPLSHVVGNPPWVKWSHLPPEYAQFIKPDCDALGVFSEDAWVGGIEADISTVITYTAALRWLREGGTLAFLITGTVFSNESSQGFRRFQIPGSPAIPLNVREVEDYKSIAPFEDVSNHTTLLIFTRGSATSFPVPYRVWSLPPKALRSRAPYANAADFRSRAIRTDLLAAPVPGTDAGPWLRGDATQHALWGHLFGNAGTPAYQARKGITTDANGLFFLHVQSAPRKITSGRKTETVTEVAIDPKEGRRPLGRATGDVEDGHLFALLRGEGVAPFRATADAEHAVLLPQRTMNGDPDLPRTSPHTYAFLKPFESVLKARGSYRRFQSKHSYWSLWTVGPDYTFAPYKVAWREMPGGRFAAAMASTAVAPKLGRRLVIPDHKVYFVPLQSRAEAAYLTALLNAPSVSRAIGAYAATLSLGTSVVEYLRIPPFDPTNADHRALAVLGLSITRRTGRGGEGPTTTEDAKLDEITLRVLGVPAS